MFWYKSILFITPVVGVGNLLKSRILGFNSVLELELPNSPIPPSALFLLIYF